MSGHIEKIYIIIKSILKDWFTARIAVTLTVVGVFVLSFIAIFFVTTKVATEYLEDSNTEKHYYNERVLGAANFFGKYDGHSIQAVLGKADKQEIEETLNEAAGQKFLDLSAFFVQYTSAVVIVR